MHDIQNYVSEAERICVYSEGAVSEYERETEAFRNILCAWEEMTENAVPMPAFGVSLDKLTREERQHGLWVEFVFSSCCRCQGMPFSRLLCKVAPSDRGFNLIRCNDEKYEGRCFYLDLRGGNMQPLYDALCSAVGKE